MFTAFLPPHTCKNLYHQNIDPSRKCLAKISIRHCWEYQRSTYKRWSPFMLIFMVHCCSIDVSTCYILYYIIISFKFSFHSIFKIRIFFLQIYREGRKLSEVIVFWVIKSLRFSVPSFPVNLKYCTMWFPRFLLYPKFKINRKNKTLPHNSSNFETSSNAMSTLTLHSRKNTHTLSLFLFLSTTLHNQQLSSTFTVSFNGVIHIDPRHCGLLFSVSAHNVWTLAAYRC